MFEHAGGTIFDSQIGREFFRPWNSEAVKNLFSYSNNFFLIRIFLYIAIPMFILVMFAAENFSRKEFGKNVKTGDDSRPAVWITLMIISLICLCTAMFIRRRRT